MPRKKSEPDPKSSSKLKKFKPACIFCLSNVHDEPNLGKMYKAQDFRAHYYCMLFASGLRQQGASDNDGILGFLPKDIKDEVKRGSRLKCCYCKQKGATIGCCSKVCRKVFHLYCGIKHNSMHQFYGTFCSLCSIHRLYQNVPAAAAGPSPVTCPICLSSIEAKVSFTSLKSPCCNNSWFHRSCIQKQALNAGYFFKCPICNDQEVFQEEMLQFGIYIPQQDASWEREDNAFEDLLFRHNRCDAKICNCSRGRNYDRDASKWEVKLCSLCGSQGIHLGCGHLRSIDSPWECPPCKEILKRDSMSVDTCSESESSDRLKRAGEKRKRKRSESFDGPKPTFHNTRVKALSFSSETNSREMIGPSQQQYVQVSLSHDTHIKISVSDWTCLVTNAARLRQKLKMQQSGFIAWPDLKKDNVTLNAEL